MPKPCGAPRRVRRIRLHRRAIIARRRARGPPERAGAVHRGCYPREREREREKKLVGISTTHLAIARRTKPVPPHAMLLTRLRKKSCGEGEGLYFNLRDYISLNSSHTSGGYCVRLASRGSHTVNLIRIVQPAGPSSVERVPWRLEHPVVLVVWGHTG